MWLVGLSCVTDGVVTGDGYEINVVRPAVMHDRRGCLRDGHEDQRGAWGCYARQTGLSW